MMVLTCTNRKHTLFLFFFILVKFLSTNNTTNVARGRYYQFEKLVLKKTFCSLCEFACTAGASLFGKHLSKWQVFNQLLNSLESSSLTCTIRYCLVIRYCLACNWLTNWVTDWFSHNCTPSSYYHFFEFKTKSGQHRLVWNHNHHCLLHLQFVNLLSYW